MFSLEVLKCFYNSCMFIVTYKQYTTMCFLTLPPNLHLCTAKKNAKTKYIKCMFAYTL